ncbi:MAG TPA: hypothetical protein VJB89_03510 [Candidatus Nanoarchaeia archaeon]|nr:hypothetical protein [Candidatus Nanoarchaeia archaeon]
MEDKYFYISLAVAILILGSLGFTGYVFWNKENSDMLGNCEFIDSEVLFNFYSNYDYSYI